MKIIAPNSASTLVRDRRGGVAVLVALGITVLAGFTGVALDIGSYYILQHKLQNTADAAALASVTLVKPGGAAAVRTRGVCAIPCSSRRRRCSSMSSGRTNNQYRGVPLPSPSMGENISF